MSHVHQVAATISGLIAAAQHDSMDTIDVEIPPPFSIMTLDAFRRGVGYWNEHGRDLIETAPSRACPACGCASHDLMFHTFDGYPTVECSDCSIWYIPKVVDSSLFDRFFERSPAARTFAREMIEARLQSTGEGDVSRVTGYLLDLHDYLDAGNAGQTYLDVGCNVGHSLKAAQDLGFAAHGIEINPDAVNVARQRGFNVRYPGDLPEGQTFGIVSFWETLEHINDPAGVLASLADRIAEGGVLAISVPNLNCAEVRLLRNDCSFVQGGRTWTGHINLFSLESLERLFGRIGFKLLDADGQYACNYLALAGYMSGSFKGVRSLIRTGRQSVRLSQKTYDLINNTGPYLTNLERSALLSPILRVVACRADDHVRLSSVAKAKRRERTALHSGPTAPN